MVVFYPQGWDALLAGSAVNVPFGCITFPSTSVCESLWDTKVPWHMVRLPTMDVGRSVTVPMVPCGSGHRKRLEQTPCFNFRRPVAHPRQGWRLWPLMVMPINNWSLWEPKMDLRMCVISVPRNCWRRCGIWIPCQSCWEQLWRGRWRGVIVECRSRRFCIGRGHSQLVCYRWCPWCSESTRFHHGSRGHGGQVCWSPSTSSSTNTTTEGMTRLQWHPHAA